MKGHDIVDDGCAPHCRCGNEKMIVRCGGKFANHPGRFYYKCPVNGKHTQSFIWCDEYQNNSSTSDVQDFLRQPHYNIGPGAKLHASTTSEKP
ncbi:hypothetical protein AAHA92_05492 [Salvia divinorum]|uniref:GRF-type domain-containing protein n=1 Tax=Salvia divinorum TaxID=28513 RepID=A0ABD1I2K7_SALDI